MQKSLAKSARIALGITVLGAFALGGLGCGGSSSHPNPDAKDTKGDSSTGSAGGDGSAGTTGTAGGDGSAGTTGAAGTDGGAGTTGAAGTDGGAGTTGAAGTDGGAGTTGAAGTDGGAGTTGAAGTDGGAGTTGAAGTDGGAGEVGADGAAGSDAAAGADGGAGSDGGASDAADAADVPCVNACTLGAKQCGSGGGIQTCVAGSSTCTVWSTAVSCGTHSSCSAAGGTAACGCDATSCTATGQFCSSTTGRTDCAQDSDGCFFATGAAVACGQRQTCTGVAGAATCTCNTDPSCGTGTATFCASGSSQSSCGTDADGCFFVQSTTACPVHESCTGNNPTGKCTCDAAPAECVGGSGATFCATSSSVSTCKTDSNTCVFADVAVGCGTHQACTGNPGVGACTCVVDANCTGTGDICVGSSSVHCAQDATTSCFFTQQTIACGPNETCNGGTGLCACNATVCTAAGPFCDVNGHVATCSQETDADGQTCLFVSGNATTCSTNATCSGAAGGASCVCNPAPAGCTGAGTFCRNLNTQAVCTTDGTCPASNAAADTACPANQTCKSGALGGTCTCDNTCTAAQAGGGAGTYCLDALHQQSCTNDPNGCHIANSPVSCVGVQTCQGPDGVGSCQCPPAGVTAGTGCTTLGATVCQGDTVLTCINDAASGCHYWAQPLNCNPALVCGTKSGVAACQCPDHVGGDYFADPVAGSDAQVGIFPTGINSPSACRFGTLGKALSLATTAGNRVIATTAAPPHNFAAETFPLTVSDGVTLTTDTPLLPANYTVVFNSGGATSAISLGNSSIAEGLTVLNNGGNPAAFAIFVTGIGATVDTVVLDGTGGTTLARGIGVTGTGSINNATITGFTNGFGVLTTSGSVTLTNSNIDANGTGISLGSGTLGATNVTVNGGSGAGVVVSAAAGGLTSTFNATALTVSNMTGAGISQFSAGGTQTFNVTSGDIGHNGGGGITLSAGTGTLGAVNVHQNTGPGITQSGGTLLLGSGGTTTVNTNTTTGVTLSGGTLTVGAATITANTSDGVAASGSSTLVSNTGAQYTNNGGNGINAPAATLTMNGSAASPILVSGNTLDGILISGGNMKNASYLTLSGNGTGGTKKSGLEVTGVGTAVSLGTASDAALSLTGNGLHGAFINGIGTGAAVVIQRASITNNGAANVGSDGIKIDLNGGAAANAAQTSLSALTITGNGSNGVEVLRAPAAVSAVVMTMDSLTVSGNGKAGAAAGIYLSGVSGAVAASVTNNKIFSNTGVGLHVSNLGVGAMTETIQGNDINQNSTNGILFDGVTTLAGFSGNVVHGNTGDQIAITARQVGNATYNFKNGSATPCDANRNQVYCYAPGIVGIRVSTAGGVAVNAEFMSWEHAGMPAAGTDYVVGPGGTAAIDATNFCGNVATCP